MWTRFDRQHKRSQGFRLAFPEQRRHQGLWAQSKDGKPGALDPSWALAFCQELPEASTIMTKN